MIEHEEGVYDREDDPNNGIGYIQEDVSNRICNVIKNITGRFAEVAHLLRIINTVVNIYPVLKMMQCFGKFCFECGNIF
jgi:hypothetical protein